ncbi:carbohydrate sulfotransferase 1-like [Diadema antillarum]|uniref:carbohydrate sulfotransferase 1-like n=1 Tax=Diadema antillarum TaxID=105358 RepID=UPI003A8BB659
MSLKFRRQCVPGRLRPVFLLLLPIIVFYTVRYLVKRYECSGQTTPYSDCDVGFGSSSRRNDQASVIKAVQGNIVVEDLDDHDRERQVGQLMDQGGPDGVHGREVAHDDGLHADVGLVQGDIVERKDLPHDSPGAETKITEGNKDSEDLATSDSDDGDDGAMLSFRRDEDVVKSGSAEDNELEGVENLKENDALKAEMNEIYKRTHDNVAEDKQAGNEGGVDQKPPANKGDEGDKRVTASIQNKKMLETSNDDDAPVFVIIMAQWRFGSSVIGELFNQNPEVFYLFEPLLVVEDMVKLWRIPGPFTRETYYYSMKILGDIAKCDFGDKVVDFVNITNSQGGRTRNRAICEALPLEADRRIPDALWLRDLCQKHNRSLATKIIRGELGMIKPLVVSDKVNVKVIHLVRDPRGSMASRLNYLYEWGHENLAHKNFSTSGRLKPLQLLDKETRHMESVPFMCSWLRENFMVPSQLPEWLHGRYLPLRYEDFADDPVGKTEELYQFVGWTLPDSVREWVKQNTNAQMSDQGTFGIAKNATATASRWMSELSEVEIGQVESLCMDVMKLLGYPPYSALKRNT